MTGFLRRVTESTATVPALVVYVAAVGLGALAAAGTIRFDVAAVLLGVSAALVILTYVYRQVSTVCVEVSTVHGLVNSQHDALVERVDQLSAALTAAGVQIPHDTTGGAR